MGLRDFAIGILLSVLVYQAREYLLESQRRSRVTRLLHSDNNGEHRLHEHSKVFSEKKVLKVTPNIYVAVGYALANSVMIVGENGIIIVDVTESIGAGKEVLADFRKITQKPIKGIVYTHNHGDHIYGAKAFIEDAAHPPEIWAHADLLTHLQRQFYTSSIMVARASRQFGVYVPEHINAGIGPKLRISEDQGQLGIVYPTKLMVGIERDITIAGVNLKLVHIPGETEDQIGVWVPQDQAFLCADDVYQAFPNLYAIRGTPTRDLLHWVSSLDRILALKPKHLVPSHTLPLEGVETILELLTGYRDAIQFVHDQTIRYMNKGYLPDEIAETVKLPQHLAAHPYLQEFYGTVAWSVKGVFNAYMGWFSGDPVDLSPLTPNEMAEKVVSLAGGPQKVTELAENALAKKEYQWALVLSSYVLRADRKQNKAKDVKVKSLMALGNIQTSANGRNYYHTTALEELGEANVAPSAERHASYIKNVPIFNLFKTFQVRWNAEDCGVLNSTLVFHFTDTKEAITMTTRNAIVLIEDRISGTPNIKVTTTSAAWRESIISSFSALSNLALGQLKIEGSLTDFKRVISCFDKS